MVDEQNADYQLIVDFFTGRLYELARNAIIRYEAIAFEGADAHWIELRDAVEHVRQALLTEDLGERQARMGSAAEHLRRAGVEPTQELVEYKVERILKATKWYWVKRLLYRNLPSERSIYESLTQISHYLEGGRAHKADEESYSLALQDLAEAHRLGDNLDRAVTTDLLRTWYIVAGLLAVIAGIIGLPLTVLFFLLTS